MEEIIIYRFQLEAIKEALRITANIHHSNQRLTCHDRQVMQGYQFAENALIGEKDKEVSYYSSKGEL